VTEVERRYSSSPAALLQLQHDTYAGGAHPRSHHGRRSPGRPPRSSAKQSPRTQVVATPSAGIQQVGINTPEPKRGQWESLDLKQDPGGLDPMDPPPQENAFHLGPDRDSRTGGEWRRPRQPRRDNPGRPITRPADRAGARGRRRDTGGDHASARLTAERARLRLAGQLTASLAHIGFAGWPTRPSRLRRGSSRTADGTRGPRHRGRSRSYPFLSTSRALNPEADLDESRAERSSRPSRCRSAGCDRPRPLITTVTARSAGTPCIGCDDDELGSARFQSEPWKSSSLTPWGGVLGRTAYGSRSPRQGSSSGWSPCPRARPPLSAGCQPEFVSLPAGSETSLSHH